jgi:acetyl esterase/lipase
MFSALPAAAQDAAWTKETFLYKTVGPTKIEADVYRRNGTTLRPAVVWIHGGALILGDRRSVPDDIAELGREQNYVLVSIDYRLAPETKLPAIIEDLQDFFRWLRAFGRDSLHVDPQKIVVTGGSAGGYLTLMSGICVEPRPKALVAYWGYGDVDGPWYAEPSAHYRRSPLVTRLEAESAVGGPPKTRPDGRPRGKYYLYLRQNGLWPLAVTGFDPHTERHKLTPYCPVRNVTPHFPPTLLVHGTLDTDVPYQESVDMAAALKKHNVPHELVTVAGAGHGLSGADPQAARAARERALAFIRQHLD